MSAGTVIRVYVVCAGCGAPVEDLVARRWNRQDYHRDCLPPDVACCWFCGDAHAKADMKFSGTGLLCKCCEKGMASGTD